VIYRIPTLTTMTAAQAAVNGIESMRRGKISVKPLQDYYAANAAGRGLDAPMSARFSG
jgi:hypothetical protein